jgi:hypothetical protein
LQISDVAKKPETCNQPTAIMKNRKPHPKKKEKTRKDLKKQDKHKGKKASKEKYCNEHDQCKYDIELSYIIV